MSEERRHVVEHWISQTPAITRLAFPNTPLSLHTSTLQYRLSLFSNHQLMPPPPLKKQKLFSQESVKTVSSNALITVNDLPVRNVPRDIEMPEWHAPWKLMRVISGHTGWVRCIDVDVTNEWFVTGSADRTVKIWDLASGKLKLTLTGNVHGVRGIVISQRHPYMFTVGEDKTVRCWDLEQNKVIRYYHGHLSGVHACDLHPSIDVLVTGGRDSTARVWI